MKDGEALLRRWAFLVEASLFPLGAHGDALYELGGL